MSSIMHIPLPTLNLKSLLCKNYSGLIIEVELVKDRLKVEILMLYFWLRRGLLFRMWLLVLIKLKSIFRVLHFEEQCLQGRGAKYAEDKVIQYNSRRNVIITNYCIQDFGKLYRSCGNCKTQYKRYGDVATITKSSLTLSNVDSICDTYEKDLSSSPEETGSQGSEWSWGSDIETDVDELQYSMTGEDDKLLYLYYDIIGDIIIYF
ncbi:hypothetical protein C8Q75DRAFT_736199 [Abortiporus biennis]|nr:hypothetical protein C8Q75DRAFT_736199 [Abortiporus biennis]